MNMRTNNMITFEKANELFRYDREAELKYGFHSNHGTNKAAYVKKR